VNHSAVLGGHFDTLGMEPLIARQSVPDAGGKLRITLSVGVGFRRGGRTSIEAKQPLEPRRFGPENRLTKYTSAALG